MPWQEQSSMSLRQEFVALASQPNTNIRALCARFQISPTTGYKWIKRYQTEGEAGLHDRSRRPRHSPAQTTDAMEQRVLALRDKRAIWSGRKLKRRLEDLGVKNVPAASTITAILRRHNRLHINGEHPQNAFIRFEHDAPNKLWQMDFKGWVKSGGGRCMPLTVIDDHSRYALGVKACSNERYETVQAQLQAIFERYGLPDRITADNGQPWGSSQGRGVLTQMGVWFIDIGVRLSHSRPYHPQTQGKNERFNQTLKKEAMQGLYFSDLKQWQAHFDGWRTIYNHERPHEALNLDTPATRYRISSRSFPQQIAPFDYLADDQLRKVGHNGQVQFKGKRIKISEALRKREVAIRPMTDKDGEYAIYYRQQKLTTFTL